MKTSILSRPEGLVLTFESGVERTIYGYESIAYAKEHIVGSWRPEGIVKSVKRLK